MEQETSDKFIIKSKFSLKNKERERHDKINIKGININNTSSSTINQKDNNEKKYDEEKENLNINKDEKDKEITPDNFDLIKVIKLKNNLKWFLFKKIKNKSNIKNKPKEYQTKTLNRRYRYYSHQKTESIAKDTEENNQSNDSFSNYLWKPQKNRKEYLDFCINNKETSEEQQKKIENLEKNLKEIEEKLDKKEKDFNRLNLNYAKMINRSKKQDINSNEELMEKLEKIREENKKLKNTINKYKSEQQFIGLSFIEDDLEGEQFIDDKCFEDILDGLIDENRNLQNNREKDIEKNNGERTKNINYGKNNFYFESKIGIEKSCINTINTNNTINNPSSRHLGARGFYKSKRKNI